MKIKGILLLFVLFLFCFSAEARNGKNDYILVLNSVTFQGVWAELYQQIEAECIRQELGIKSEELSIPALKTEEEVLYLRSRLVAKYARKPKVVIFIGDPAWIACSPIFDREWKDIPVMVCFSDERVPVKLQDLLDKKILTEENSIPTAEFNKKYNATALGRNFFVEETINMIRGIMPGIKKIALISDSRYISMVAREKMKLTIKNKFPFLKLDLLTSESINTQQLIDTISSYDQTVGIIYYSWYTQKKGSSTPYVSDNLKKIIGNFASNPVFTLSETDTKSGFFAGGYYIPIIAFSEKVIADLNLILAGEKASNILPEEGGKPIIALNYMNLRKYNINPENFPKNAVYFQTPPTFYEKYRPYINASSILIIVLIIFSYFYRDLKRVHKAKAKAYADHYRRMVDSMPMLYARKQILSDSDEVGSDCILLEVNSTFEKNFKCLRKQVVGRKVSELCKEGYPFLWICKDEAMNKVSGFSYTDTTTEKVYYFDKISFLGEVEDIVEVFCTNKTEQYESEAKARDVIDLNQRIINSIYEPIYWISRDGTIEKVLNNSDDKRSIAIANQFAGKNVKDILFEEEYLKHMELLNKVLLTRKTERILVHPIGAEKEEYSFIVRMVYFDKDRILSFVQNISELEKGRKKSEEARFFVEQIIDNLPIPTTVKDMNNGGKYIFWNQEAARVYGYSSDMLIGNSVDIIKNKFVVEEFKRLDELVVAGNCINPVYTKMVLDDDKEHFFLLNKKLVSFNDQCWMVSSTMDFTELQDSKLMLEEINQKYELVLQTVKLIPWTWDLKKSEFRCNIQYVGAVKTKKVSEIIYTGYKLDEFIHPEDLPRVQSVFDDLATGRRTSAEEEYRINNFPGMDGYVWIKTFVAIGKRDEYGAPLMLVGALMSIDNRKKLEYELRDAKEKAEESNRLKSAFLANMSHEIRTPLNAIVGFSGILPYTEDEEEKQEYIKIIENNNTLLLQLINDILDLSKIEAGMLSFSYSNIDINQMMEEIEQSSALRIKTDQVKLAFEDRLPECILHTDRNRIMQVLTNFITNAIKFTPQGHINIGYRLKDEKTLYFYVRDTGCGIGADKQKEIFHRFVKLNDFAQGTGLGLSISEMIVSRLGGEIGVFSEIGKGSEFWFTLPYEPPVYVTSPLPRKQESLSVIKKSEGKPVVLLAEDNPSNFRLFETILKKSYILVHAWDGQEAVKLFREYDPDIILMDIKMPVMGGYEAVKEIRDISVTVPVIAVTAFAFADDEQKIMSNGFDDYTTKPINALALISKIEKHLSR